MVLTPDLLGGNQPESYGIGITMIPGDPRFQIQLQRAPDDGSGSPGTFADLAYLPPFQNAGTYIDLLPHDNTFRHYRWRHFGPGYDASLNWSAVGRGRPVRLEGAAAAGGMTSEVSLAARKQIWRRIGTHSQQLLPNQGFEDGLAFWLPSTPGGGSASVVTDSTKAHSGNRYLSLAPASGQFGNVFASDETGATRYFEVQPGDVVQFGGYAYRESGTSNIYYGLQTLDKDFNVIAFPTTPTQNTAAWVLVQAEYIIPAGIKYVAFFAQGDNAGTATVARFDDCVLRIAFGVSTIHNPQGSVLPIAADVNLLNHSDNTGPGPNTGWVAWTWSAFTLPRPDGTNISVPANTTMFSDPPAPTLSEVVGGGPAGGHTYFVKISYMKDGHVIGLSAESTKVIAAGNQLKITSPASVAGMDGWTMFIGTTTGNNFDQLAPVNFGTDYQEGAAGATTAGTTKASTSWSKAIVDKFLGPSTAYWWYPYWDAINSFIRMNVAAGVQTAANAKVAQLDGHIALSSAGITITMPAANLTASGAKGAGRLL